MNIEIISINKIKLNPNNPRLIKDDKFNKLVKSIQDFPEMLKIRPIVVNDDMIVLGGNMRLKACKEAGLKEIPIIKASDLTEEQQREFIIKDNVGYGEWDFALLTNDYDLDLLTDWGLDMPDLESDKSEQLEAKEDEYVIPDEIKTDIVYGDLFEIGEHRLLCGDSTKSEDVERLMGAEKAEILFTSPPYSDMREYNGDKDLSVNNIIKFIQSFSAFANYQVINLGIQRKNNNIFPYWNEYIDKAKDCGYLFLAWNVWAKQNAGSVGNQTAFFPIAHEWIFVFGYKFKDINRTWERKTEITNRKTRGIRQSDGSIKQSTIGDQQEFKEMESVLFCNTELGEIRSKHPATFPIDLPSEYIKAMTNIGDNIIEPFTGSGTTMVASHQLKRKCFGMELDPKYCQVIVERMVKLDSSLTIKRNGFDETEKWLQSLS